MKPIFIMGFCILASLLFLAGCLSKTSYKYDGCFESKEDGELLCITVESGSSSVATKSISINPTNPKGGQSFEIALGFELPSYGYEVGTSKVYLQDINGNSIRSWDISYSIPSNCDQGCSLSLTLQAQAPQQSGQFQIYVYIVDTHLNKLYTEVKKFAVESVACPNPSCNSWELMQTMTNGKQYHRQCYSYGSAPACSETIAWQYKTECNSEYVCSGMSTNICDEATSCVLSQAEPDCSSNSDCSDSDTCTKDECISGTCQNTFISGCDNTIPPDDSDPCANKDCNDNNPCTIDSCNAGICVNEIVGCADGKFCDFNGECVDDSICEGKVCELPELLNAQTCECASTQEPNPTPFDFKKFLSYWGIPIGIILLLILLAIIFAVTNRKSKGGKAK